jgi:hypothetical protein
MLTVEQERALNELIAHLPPRPQPNGTGPQPNSVGPLQLWFGLSEQELQAKLFALLDKKNQLEGQLLDWVEANPFDANFTFLGAAAIAFYHAEKGVNPRIHTYIDAYYYISTCASVGYADIFAMTQTGRLISSLVMTVGPALSNMALQRPIPRKINGQDQDNL